MSFLLQPRQVARSWASMPDYMDLEAWGCPDAHDNDGKACVEDLVTALVPHLA